MASQKHTSVVSDIVKVTFRAKVSMSEDHWKEIGALLRKRTRNDGALFLKNRPLACPIPSSPTQKICRNHPTRRKMAYALFCAGALSPLISNVGGAPDCV